MSEKLLSYLACPYTHKDPRIMQRRFETVTRAAGWLTAHTDWAVFSPITHSHPIHQLADGIIGGDWATWERVDMLYLRCCCRIITLTIPGWSVSTGVRAERACAKHLCLDQWRINPIAEGFRLTSVLNKK